MNVVFDQFIETLQRTETLPLRELSRYQQRLLIPLIRHAHDRLPFYRERLDRLFTVSGEIDLTRWNSVPFLTRDDIIARGREMRVADLPADYGEITETRTSGSTGVPLEIATNSMVFFTANALLTRAARRFGVDTSRPMAIIGRFQDDPAASYPDGTIKKGWSLGDPAAPYYELDVMTPVDQQIEWLARRKTPYLTTLPSDALAIAYSITPEQGRDLGIEVVLLIGETVRDDARKIIAERLGARVAAIYACREIGHIASECEMAPHYHVAIENALVEIVDNEGRDVIPGSRGRVIVTGLYNYVMPFIRYEIGDMAVAGTKRCSCGRTLPVIEQIEGRTRNMFVFRDGTRVWPRASMIRPMHAFVPFSRFQLVQLDYETIEFRYVSDGSRRQPNLPALNAYARKMIHPSVNLRLIELENFLIGPSGKLEEFVSNLPAPNAPP